MCFGSGNALKSAARSKKMVWLDGKWMKEAEARVSCADGGFLRGEGVFETMLALGGQPFAFSEHWSRLTQGADAFGLKVMSSQDAEAIAKELLVRNGLVGSQERVRLRVTRSPQHLLFTAAAVPQSVGLEKVLTSGFVRNERSPLSGLKAISYGENALALSWGQARGATEVILGNSRKEWCEGTWSNVFAVESGELWTPPLTSGCLPGVTRGIIIALAKKEGIVVREEARPLEWLQDVEELFLTSSLRGVRSVGELDGRELQRGACSQRFSQLLGSVESGE